MAACRAQAAKQAELAARDLMRLSRPGSKGMAGASAASEGSGFAWSFLSHLSAMLLNRLQMTITSIHICFQVSLPSACAVQKQIMNKSLPALQLQQENHHPQLLGQFCTCHANDLLEGMTNWAYLLRLPVRCTLHKCSRLCRRLLSLVWSPSGSGSASAHCRLRGLGRAVWVQFQR